MIWLKIQLGFLKKSSMKNQYRIFINLFERLPCLCLAFCCLLFLLFDCVPTYAEKGPEFKSALPGWKYVFPRDHGPHREFKTEWWYYNGHLQDTSGNSYGYQMTFFRVGLFPGQAATNRSRWRAREAYLAHLTITDVHQGTFLFQEKADRGNLGLAGADEGRYRVWVENWQVFQGGREHQIIAGDRNLGFSLKLLPLRAPMIHGLNGISQKGAGTGRASHYYSITRMETSGVLKIKGREIPVHGLSWMDHEFGSNQLAENQTGWDWFSVQLSNGMDLMIYQLRRIGGEADPYSSGTLILPDLQKRHLPWSEIQLRPKNSWKSTKSGATYPSAWEIELLNYELKLSLVPVLPDQELLTPKSTGVTYWEGKVKVRGVYKGQSIVGDGYVELTGYDTHFKPKI
jgi:predicted secreted hydrolase